MPKVLIHAYKDRMHYVNDYLIPRLVDQGFRRADIGVYTDYGSGNLAAYLASYKGLQDDGDLWHLEDDTLPDRRFYSWARGLEYFPDSIICGFGSGQYYGLRDFGYVVDPSEIWYSFPCIRIPNRVIKSFLQWFYSYDVQKQYAKKLKRGKDIDFFFRAYYVQETPCPAFNFRPCMVEHVADLIGGSVCNEERGVTMQALLFEDPDAVSNLEKWVQA